MQHRSVFVCATFCLTLLAGAFWCVAEAQTGSDALKSVSRAFPPGYVGQERCVACHESQRRDWAASSHAKSMQVASPSTLLGRFDGKPVGGGDFAAFMREPSAWARLDGANGKKADFPVAFTLGVFPLQQYLVPFSGGRLQALPFAWDSRPASEGGQRWFSLYPEAGIKPGDALHWTGRNQTWNSMCADCHSTGLRKNHDPATRAYSTTWSDINVACEACHGPGASHVAWAESGRAATIPNKDFTAEGASARGGYWGDFDERGIRRFVGPARQREVDRCAPCHARRRALTDGWTSGQPLLDSHSPALLDDTLYFADGQFQDEVFEIGSFLQSRMAQAGVVCTDCHSAHGGGLKAGGNGVCAQCHDASRFDTSSHHRHTQGSEAARCVTCHMPGRTYMGVHVRHDHSFRLPAPRRAAALGAPDPCLTCHAKRGADWAEEALSRWGGGGHRTGSKFAEALDAGRKRLSGADRLLVEAAIDASNPAIARGTALSLLARFPGPLALPALNKGLADSEPLVRLGAVRGLAPYAPPLLSRLLSPVMGDPARAVRTEAARLLASANPAERSEPFRSALKEWVEAEQLASERPESALNLGVLWAELGDAEKAEATLRSAIEEDPSFTAGAITLADLYRAEGRNGEAEQVLRKSAAAAPRAGDARYALALTLIRQGRRAEARTELERAATLSPEEPRFAYAYGLALWEDGDRALAIDIWQKASRRNPGDRNLLEALVSFARESGRIEEAARYARSLARLAPGNPDAATGREEKEPDGR
ncbi:cytochrome C family protein [Rhodomicrobium vannielii ATCC 17100]|uniref:Cytochrome C family protein n=1 Tax=Rhodomicrobium vannielii (strain ATCC 17100 / DSM 162 / LMG 4299 / NCIMB 10020 / ATH 3.1.1) TaxID=648757 RepID=E3I4R5_RHOVT|nr:tetratricopeptide repeat protein [Rhodomicrobium vannielii]ADP72737.1 cytochrome C family protein [Rhodomicrobium vannielii ATCC 17100]